MERQIAFSIVAIIMQALSTHGTAKVPEIHLVGVTDWCAHLYFSCFTSCILNVGFDKMVSDIVSCRHDVLCYDSSLLPYCVGLFSG